MPEPSETEDLEAGSQQESADAEDLEFQWSDPRDYQPPDGIMRKAAGTSAGSAIGAAMVALGEILEPEKTRVEIQQEDDEPEPDLPFTIDFGDLPPLT
ncbi:MAG: hypothetical protein KTV68_14395 [Acidimicrobiia bacterium]|nr:hypothetical protein [Acidimicrobiia bacterium]MCY4432791.1 hypothetical protein [bacterium]